MSLSNSGNEKKVRVDICDQLIDGRYLNAADSSFLEFVLQDVQNYYDKCIQTSILVFPPFNNYRRFLIHKLIEDHFDNLSTFSIGHSVGRRTVVCWKDQLLSKESLGEPSCITIDSSMGVQKQSDSKEDQEPKVMIPGSERKKARALPDVAIYRPPALRKSDEGPSPSSANERKPRASKQRRPDIAVYVPRALRGVQKPAVSPKLPFAPEVIDKPPTGSSCGGNVEDNTTYSRNGKTNIDRRNGRGNARTLSQSSDSTPESGSKMEEATQPVHSLSIDSSLDSEVHETSRENCVSISSSVEFRKNCEEGSVGPSNESAENVELRKSAERKDDSLSVHSEINVCDENGSDSVAKMESVVSEDTEEKCATDGQLSVAKLSCVEMNGSSVVGKYTENPLLCEDSEMVPCESDLVTPEKSESAEVTVPQDKVVSVQSKRRKSSGISKGDGDTEEKNSKASGAEKNSCNFGNLPGGRTGASHSNDDGVPLSSWEDLFELPDDTIEVTKAGESKTQKLIEEVASAVGKVNVVEKPRCNYSQYRTDNANFLSELSHVVEIYGFPAEFKTQDLISVLSPFGGGNSGAPAFEIKWVDDTHALAVFASSFVAADVLSLNHPLVKTRPLDESSAASKAKARKTCESLRIPFRPRPETCPAMAQRLITGALGVNRRQSKAEREEERRLLREARGCVLRVRNHGEGGEASTQIGHAQKGTKFKKATGGGQWTKYSGNNMFSGGRAKGGRKGPELLRNEGGRGEEKHGFLNNLVELKTSKFTAKGQGRKKYSDACSNLSVVAVEGKKGLGGGVKDQKREEMQRGNGMQLGKVP
ncbi:hypothetical protein J437_LFUL005160 [Ladona fulva]|uniref:R3H domain-containing protein n=1 Tax=Ladona fulva TaxID=123851 RepID=A0A8K0NWW5_LADFU|nr:hypothetical protein J437_LFUL005160 [Ladona fulva]